MKTDISSVLWDIKREDTPDLPRDFVVKRVLSYGTIRLILETINNYGIAYVREVFESLKPTAMSAKKYSYLKNYLLK